MQRKEDIHLLPPDLHCPRAPPAGPRFPHSSQSICPLRVQGKEPRKGVSRMQSTQKWEAGRPCLWEVRSSCSEVPEVPEAEASG